MRGQTNTEYFCSHGLKIWALIDKHHFPPLNSFMNDCIIPQFCQMFKKIPNTPLITVLFSPTVHFLIISRNRLHLVHLPHSDLLSQKKGLFIAIFFSSCSVSVRVALKSRVCLLAGKKGMIVSRSLVKSVQPCSNSRSASSMI